MTDKVAELVDILEGDEVSKWVTNLWSKWDNERAEIKSLWKEQDEYVFATDTSTTSTSSLPWKNSTVNPKLCQIRDNLHSNYLASLFPNDNWLVWEAHDQDSAKREKSEIIEAYIENKTRLSGYRDCISHTLYDYIDRGNAFIMETFESRYNVDENGDRVSAYVGPKSVRINPYDIVFNPLANSFEETSKIVRSHKSLGEVKKMIRYMPEEVQGWKEVINRREKLNSMSSGISREDWEKASQIAMDGFGNYQTYLETNTIEILEFYGDYYNSDTNELEVNKLITVADRAVVVRSIDIPTISGKPHIRHVGWRKRSNNLWHQGPLENLVGMQYRIDHLENARADAIDLIIQPPLKIVGSVEEFDWGPGETIHIDEGGDVLEVSKSFNGIIAAQNDIADYENKMEMYAGAPREAMGIRTPGEKTAFEVQRLENASGRIFQEKTTSFEIMMEKNLNDKLEISVRNMDGSDLIRVFDDDLKAAEFKTITKEDIKANGIIRPVGARHFAQKAQDLQNLVGIMSSPMAEFIKPHTSGKNLVKFIDDVVNLKAYKIFRDNVGVTEAQETNALANQAEEDNIMAMSTEPEESL